MPEYTYTGVDKQGRRVTGQIDAPNEGELRMLLRGQGVRPMRISRVSMIQADLGTLLRGGKIGKIPANILAAFTRQLHVLVGSGIPLVQSLEILGEQSVDPSLKKILLTVKEKVSGGAFFWESLSTYKDSLPRIYISLIRAGESAGALEQILDRLANYLESADRLAKQVKSAMMYPVIVILVAAGVIGGMLVFVIPKFEEIIASSGGELPGPTKFVIFLSNFMVNNITFILGGLAALILILYKYAQSEEGRGVIHRLAFKVPVFGDIMQKSGIARFTRTLGTLLSSGINLIDAIDICKNTVDNVVIEEAVGKIRRDVEAGKSISSVLARFENVFPKMTVQMVAVGENTGNLEKMLERVAAIYETDVETLVGGLSKLIEPILLVVLGGLVAGMMVAMYLPIFKIAGSAGGV